MADRYRQVDDERNNMTSFHQTENGRLWYARVENGAMVHAPYTVLHSTTFARHLYSCIGFETRAGADALEIWDSVMGLVGMQQHRTSFTPHVKPCIPIYTDLRGPTGKERNQAVR